MKFCSFSKSTQLWVNIRKKNYQRGKEKQRPVWPEGRHKQCSRNRNVNTFLLIGIVADIRFWQSGQYHLSFLWRVCFSLFSAFLGVWRENERRSEEEKTNIAARLGERKSVLPVGISNGSPQLFLAIDSLVLAVST